MASNLAELKKGALARANNAGPQLDPIKSKVDLLERHKDLLRAGASASLLVEREISAATRMLTNSRDLQESSQDSFYSAVSDAINTGIGLCNGRGYLVAEKGICKFIPGWKGLIDLVSRTGRASAWTGVVYKGDKFDYELGCSPYLRHKQEGDSDDWADATHVYAIGRIKGQEYPIIEVWSIKKVIKHLSKYNTVGGEHYALKDDNSFEMYARKLVLLRAIKYLPSSQDLDAAVAAAHAAETYNEVVQDGNFADMPGYERQDDQQFVQQAQQPIEPPATRPAQQRRAPVQQPLADEVPTPIQRLKLRLATLTDVDILDIEADLINGITTDPSEQAALRNTYRARRATLTSAADGFQPAANDAQARHDEQPQDTPAARAPVRRRQGMSID